MYLYTHEDNDWKIKCTVIIYYKRFETKTTIPFSLVIRIKLNNNEVINHQMCICKYTYTSKFIHSYIYIYVLSCESVWRRCVVGYKCWYNIQSWYSLEASSNLYIEGSAVIKIQWYIYTSRMKYLNKTYTQSLHLWIFISWNLNTFIFLIQLYLKKFKYSSINIMRTYNYIIIGIFKQKCW